MLSADKDGRFLSLENPDPIVIIGPTRVIPRVSGYINKIYIMDVNKMKSVNMEDNEKVIILIHGEDVVQCRISVKILINVVQQVQLKLEVIMIADTIQLYDYQVIQIKNLLCKHVRRNFTQLLNND